MKKVILCRPNYKTHLITPPLGLGYISSYLESKGYATEIIDGLNLALSNEDIVERCAGADIIGISCMSAYFSEVTDLARKLKDKGFKVVIGGPHASALPELTLQETDADYVIAGEGEVSFAELLEKGETSDSLSGVIGRSDKNLKKSELIKDLDSLPFPDWQKMKPQKYRKAPHGGLIKNFPVAPVITSRGCPFTCTFCASPSLWERKIRFRSPENVVNELQYLITDFGIREIHFEDDNLTLKREHIESICRLILRKRIKISWATPNGVRADTLDIDMLRLMKESGCYYLAFGIESGNQDILNQIKKKETLSTIEKAVKQAKALGFLTQGFFIFGLPGETEQTIINTIEFAKKIPLDRAQFLILDVLPGSELWDELKDERIVNWKYKSYQEVSWLPSGLTREILMRAQSSAFKKFFLRPKPMYSLFKHFKLSQLPFVITRVRDFRLLGGREDRCE